MCNTLVLRVFQTSYLKKKGNHSQRDRRDSEGVGARAGAPGGAAGRPAAEDHGAEVTQRTTLHP